MTRLLRRRDPAATEPDRTHRYRGRHRHPRRSRRPATYAAAGLLALTGHTGGPALAATRPVTTARPVVRTRHVTRPAPVRAAPVRWVVELVPGRVLRGRATWYGPGFAGHRTANGETFHPETDLTAAHRWLPFGTLLKVCRGSRCVVVRINDRGPFGHAILDLSYAAAERLGLVRPGIDEVTATVLTTRRVQVPT